MTTTTHRSETVGHVRKCLQALVEQTRRRRTADAIIASYAHHPQTGDAVAWADQATVQMIADEPW